VAECGITIVEIINLNPAEDCMNNKSKVGLVVWVIGIIAVIVGGSVFSAGQEEIEKK
jgi:hypothetical protein